MEKVRVGILGSGFAGRTHAEAISKYVKNAQLVAVAGGSRAPGLAADYGVDEEASVESLLKRDDIEAVIVATPHEFHAEQAIMAAKHGKHVLVEKPLATAIEDCDALIETCQTAGVNLMTAQTQRYRRGNRIAKQMIGEGAIGRVLMVEELQIITKPVGQPGQYESVGRLLGHGVHNPDRARWFVGDEVEWVSGIATTYTEPAPVESSSMVLLRFRNGCAATIWCTWECPPPGIPNSAFRVRVMGEKGVLDVDGYGLAKFGDNEGWKVVYEQPKFDIRVDPLSPIRMESYSLQDQEFINSIVEQRPPEVTGEDGRAAVEIALAAYESNSSGRVVHLPLKRS